MKRLILLLIIFGSAEQGFANSVNIRTAPVSDFSGFPTVNFDYDVGRACSLGAGVGITLFSFGGTSPTASDFNLNATKYFAEKSFNDAWFLGPIFEVTSGSIHTLGLTETDPTAAFGGRVGYQWMWSAFNIQLAALVLTTSSYYYTMGFDFTIGWLIK